MIEHGILNRVREVESQGKWVDHLRAINLRLCADYKGQSVYSSVGKITVRNSLLLPKFIRIQKKIAIVFLDPLIYFNTHFKAIHLKLFVNPIRKQSESDSIEELNT